MVGQFDGLTKKFLALVEGTQRQYGLFEMIKKFNHTICFGYIMILAGLSCNQHIGKVSQYEAEISSFRLERLEGLKAPDGWTTLAGLYWLKAGVNFVGSNAENDLVFPDNTPQRLGHFDLQNNEVFFTSQSEVLVNSSKSARLHNYKLKADNTGKPTLLSWKSYQWHLIKRGSNFGIRLKDSLYPTRFLLDTIPCFPNDIDWRIEASISYQDTHRTVNINNVIGLNNASKIAATLSFMVNDRPYKLYAINGGPDAFFVIFADLTTGDTTYGGGRYLYPKRPNKGFKTYLDFNQAINPPCVFTAYATCPLPPPENKLTVAIEAGEKFLEIGDGSH